MDAILKKCKFICKFISNCSWSAFVRTPQIAKNRLLQEAVRSQEIACFLQLFCILLKFSKAFQSFLLSCKRTKIGAICRSAV